MVFITDAFSYEGLRDVASECGQRFHRNPQQKNKKINYEICIAAVLMKFTSWDPSVLIAHETFSLIAFWTLCF